MSKILVVDDERLTGDLLETFLKMKGFEVVRADGGRDGMTLAILEHPDLIIVDMMMPDISGDELCHLLRHNSVTQHMPILVLSALFSGESQRRARAAGADFYLPKHVPLPELYQHLNRLMSA